MSRTKTWLLLLGIVLLLTGCTKSKVEKADLYTDTIATFSEDTTQVIKGNFIKEVSFTGTV